MPEQGPRKFGIRDVVELLALAGVGTGSGLLVGVFAGVWAGIGAGILVVSAIVTFVCLYPKMRTLARDGAERRAD